MTHTDQPFSTYKESSGMGKGNALCLHLSPPARPPPDMCIYSTIPSYHGLSQTSGEPLDAVLKISGRSGLLRKLIYNTNSGNSDSRGLEEGLGVFIFTKHLWRSKCKKSPRHYLKVTTALLWLVWFIWLSVVVQCTKRLLVWFRSGHMPRLMVGSVVGGVQEATDNGSLS